MAAKAKPAYLNPDLPLSQRVDDLVSRMTLDEKISQTVHDAPPIERLGIPAYNWWNECLHGVARAGFATQFPQAIGMAATWDRALMHRAATAISDEARAKYHDNLRANKGKKVDQYYGLDYWSPNINIFRDPRWGRGHETYGECPYLTGEMGLQFVNGLQGDDPRHLKLVATPKHFAVHSGPEGLRHGFDARVSNKDLEETYLPAFRKCVVDGKAYSVMGAYNRTNGEACCAGRTLLQTILRDTWGFDGYVVSDCGAIDDIFRHHKLVATAAEAAALAVKNGCELNCGETYPMLREAVAKGLIAEADIDAAVKRLFMARFKLGMFDPEKRCRYASTPMAVVGSPKHRALALQAARESIILLKNEGRTLPLDAKKIRSVAVIGPNADNYLSLAANYYGTPSRPVTPLKGIMDALPQKARVLYDPGCDMSRAISDSIHEVRHICRQADVVIACMGLSPLVEGEEGCTLEADLAGDKRDIALYKAQLEVLKAALESTTPVVLVLLNGSAITLGGIENKVSAIIEAWYPGEMGGTAIADVLFGRYNPAGRLPVTFYASMDQVPDFADYRMDGRTYRFFGGDPLYAFGYGLSYTKFVYSRLTVCKQAIAGDPVHLSVDVKNAGPMAGDEVVQVYIRPVNPSTRAALYQLCGFDRVHLKAGAVTTVALDLPASAFSVVTDDGRRMVEAGAYDLFVGGCLPSVKGAKTLTARVRLEGPGIELAGAFKRAD